MSERTSESRTLPTALREELSASPCLITGQRGNIQICHLMPFKWTQEKYWAILTSLEHAWGWPPLSFRVNAENNLVPLQPNLHAMLDRDFWGLLPSRTVVNKFYYAFVGTRTEHCPPFDEHQLLLDHDVQYRLIPLKDFGHIPIILHGADYGDTFNLPHPDHPRCELEAFWQPFNLMPWFSSNISPRCAIVNLGIKLANLHSPGRKKLYTSVRTLPDGANIVADLEHIYEVYRRWVQPAPPWFVAMCRGRTEDGILAPPLPRVISDTDSPGLPGNYNYTGPTTTPQQAQYAGAQTPERHGHGQQLQVHSTPGAGSSSASYADEAHLRTPRAHAAVAQGLPPDFPSTPTAYRTEHQFRHIYGDWQTPS